MKRYDIDKERKAIDRLRLAAEMSETYYDQPLIITTSGGMGRMITTGVRWAESTSQSAVQLWVSSCRLRGLPDGRA